MDLQRTVNIKNRGVGRVVYTIQETGVRREFSPGETKKGITVRELEQLSYIPGGLKLLEKYLSINDNEVCEYLGIETELEYFYDEEAVKKLLVEGSLDQLKDCLDFAPTGVIDLTKKISLEIRLNDINKRLAIMEATGFDITRAIDNVDFSKETLTNDSANSGKQRRVQPESNKKQEVGRRVVVTETKE